MKIRSYGKINLTLDITGKRKDGYHNIETIFQHVSLYDDLTISPLIEDKIIVESDIKDLQGPHNTCYKAAQIIKTKYSIPQGIHIHIKKNIPLEAGLSGGSSNGAAVLKGLNRIFKLGLTEKELMELSMEIGMDVPFHIPGGTCFGKGRGEIIEEISPLPKHYVVIVHPGFGISSGEAYSSLKYNKIGKTGSTAKFMKQYDLKYLHNDFEYSVLPENPQLETIKKRLGGNSLLSGSGSCIFGIYKDQDEAKHHMDKVKDFKSVFLVETMNKAIQYADEMGICFGVKRALKGTMDVKDTEGVFVLGSLVHNNQVQEKLSQKGIQFVTKPSQVEKGTVIISSHGAPDSIIKNIEDRDLPVIDLTCPIVKKLRQVTKQKEREGKKIIILGDPDHAEIKGITDNLRNYKVISNGDDLSIDEYVVPLAFVSQTTIDEATFMNISSDLQMKCKDLEIIDTICISTKRRQNSSQKLAANSDIVIVVGGKISANTKRLYNLCSKHCETRHIETEKELCPEWFADKERIGITAGASTPEWIISEVEKEIRTIF